MTKVALIIIYNHQYNKNIEILEDLYKNRFTNIFHLVPFYTGVKDNVIPVYENSFFFQGYISQGLSTYFNNKYEHYFFIGDDLLLNPLIDQNNYKFFFNITNKSSFLPNYKPLHELTHFWGNNVLAYNYNLKNDGLEIDKFLPDYNKAISLFKKKNITIKPLNYEHTYRKPSVRLSLKSIIRNLKYLYNKNYKKLELSYPIIGGYSDIVIVDSYAIKNFSLYSGVFAATNLHVELAIPTSLVLSSKKVVTESNLKLKGKVLWHKEGFKTLKKYNNNLNNLLSDFPEKHLYIHPIKLSKWT